jgi:hypothetical protein
MLRALLFGTFMALVACDSAPEQRADVASAPAPVSKGNPLIGTKLDLSPVRWVTDDGKPADFRANRLTLLRWWTVGCPFCSDSLPALGELQRRYGKRGLGLIAVFHCKTLVAPSDEELRRYLGELKCNATLARDDDWTALRPLLARGKLDRATSISVLVDQDGVVQWVQGGPRLHPSQEPDEAAADADFRQLERLLDQRLPR